MKPDGPPEKKSWSVPYCRPCRERVETGQSGAAVWYDGSNGVDRFLFWNVEYGHAFLQENRACLAP
jgi:hypothetical protein